MDGSKRSVPARINYPANRLESMFWIAKWLTTLLAFFALLRVLTFLPFVRSTKVDHPDFVMESISGILAFSFFAAIAYGMWAAR